MKIPLDVTLRGMAPSEAVAAKVRQRALALERYSRRIQRCEVWIDADSAHHRKGPNYAVRVRITVPEEELVVDDQPREEDIYVAIRQAFDAARRKVEDYERRLSGHRRGHEQIRRRPRSEEPAETAAKESTESAPVS